MNPFRRFAFYRRVIVNLDDGSSIEGVFWRQAGPLIVLRDASYLEARSEPVALDGETLIERDRILFIQAP